MANINIPIISSVRVRLFLNISALVSMIFSGILHTFHSEYVYVPKARNSSYKEADDHDKIRAKLFIKPHPSEKTNPYGDEHIYPKLTDQCQ